MCTSDHGNHRMFVKSWMPYTDGINFTDLHRAPDAIMSTYCGCEFLRVQRLMISQTYNYVFDGFDIDDPDWVSVAGDMRRKLCVAMEQFDDPFKRNWLYGGGHYLPNPDA